ncbi:MAG: dinitrogenase iron-molybdenum cofactor biosynthesis protein [Oscillospiraceae bacterium]|jgi:predicted Fe-Mo cluster-binding NifX family protein|nr:dinitrogenase iron-molybdenum cofactor biosynthesis protein [Oscillospiraceae bacterium]
MGRTYRIALAAPDGKVVSRHFGRCERWTVADAASDMVVSAQARELPAICAAGGHDDAALDALIGMLGDCRAVAAARIGPGASARLEARGIAAFEYAGFADEAARSIAAYLDRTEGDDRDVAAQVDYA